MKIVIAIGGNMISDASKPNEPFDQQLLRVQETAKILVSIVKLGHHIVITHGNGPQVGSLLLQQESNVDGAVKLPLNVLGAMTQGQIGIMLQHALINEFRSQGLSEDVYIIPTTVLVDSSDPGFQNPTKPIGPFYSKEVFSTMKQNGTNYVELSKGFRRVVPSPDPKIIMEGDVISDLIDQGKVVIAVGGGGSPTIKTEDGKLKRVDAVIDKDLASAVLADQLDADMLLVLTNVDGVYKNYGAEDQHIIPLITNSDAVQMLETTELGAGSMHPKVKAAVRFTSNKNGRKAGISTAEYAIQTISGDAGTIITS